MVHIHQSAVIWKQLTDGVNGIDQGKSTVLLCKTPGSWVSGGCSLTSKTLHNVVSDKVNPPHANSVWLNSPRSSVSYAAWMMTSRWTRLNPQHNSEGRTGRTLVQTARKAELPVYLSGHMPLALTSNLQTGEDSARSIWANPVWWGKDVVFKRVDLGVHLSLTYSAQFIQ